MAPLDAPDPPLADERVALRPWRDDDVAWLARASRDPLVPRFTTVPPDNSEEDVRAHLLAQGPLRARGQELHLLSVERASGQRVGPLGLHHVDRQQGSAHVGYWAAAEARGRGLTTAAVQLLCGWALGPLGLRRLELRTDVENAASQRVAERCGFVRERLAEQPDPHGGGRVAVVVFGRAAADDDRRPPLT